MRTIIIFCLLASLAFSQEFTKGNFTYGFEVETAGNKINSLRLPAHFYQNLYNDGLDDVMVFNSAGESVPFVVIRPEPERFETAPSPVDLKTFPLLKDIKGESETIQVMSEIIVDLRDLNYMPIRLILSFADNTSFNDTLHIYESSGDLSEWSNHDASTIAQLSSTEGKILSDTVELNLSDDSKYLSLRVDNPAILPAVTAVRAEFNPVPIYPTPEELNIRGEKDGDGDIVFDLGGNYPAEWVDFGIESSYLFLGFEMSGAYNADGPWAGMFRRSAVSKYPYDKGIEGTALSDSRYGYYALDAVDNLPDGAGATFYWQPDILIFLSKGDVNTYTVAYGSEYYTSDDYVQSIAGNQLSLADATPVLSISEPQKVGNGLPPYDLPDENKNRGWLLKYLMMGMIVIAVILLSLAAVKLLKEVNRNR